MPAEGNDDRLVLRYQDCRSRFSRFHGSVRHRVPTAPFLDSRRAYAVALGWRYRALLMELNRAMDRIRQASAAVENLAYSASLAVWWSTRSPPRGIKMQTSCRIGPVDADFPTAWPFDRRDHQAARGPLAHFSGDARHPSIFAHPTHQKPIWLTPLILADTTAAGTI